MSYVIGAKPGNHKYLYECISKLKAVEHVITEEDGIQHKFSYYKKIPLNNAHKDYLVNILDYREKTPSGKEKHFCWVTNICPTQDNVYQLMRTGRSRWRIENETFNTLKNQGYNFEHNYGHGKNNLCSIFSILMNMAFLIDQTQQLCCIVYQKARKKMGAWYALFENVRVLMQYAIWDNWEELYIRIGLNDRERSPPELRSVIPI